MRLRRQLDGLSNLRYDVLKRERRPLYTWILVNVNVTQLTTVNVSEFKPVNAQQVAQAVANKQQPAQPGNANAIKVESLAKDPLLNEDGRGVDVQNKNIKQQTQHVEAEVVKQYNKKPQKPKKGLTPKKAISVISWVPTDYDGQLPDYLEKIEPLPVRMKPGRKSAKTVKQQEQILQKRKEQILQKKAADESKATATNATSGENKILSQRLAPSEQQSDTMKRSDTMMQASSEQQSDTMGLSNGPTLTDEQTIAMKSEELLRSLREQTLKILQQLKNSGPIPYS